MIQLMVSDADVKNKNGVGFDVQGRTSAAEARCRQRKQVREVTENEDAAIKGFNIGVNNGETAGQSVFHCHIHLIPRRPGDVENPRGGIRGVVPGKQKY